MIVKEKIIKYLKENGYDGLYHSDTQCACLLDDLMPCGEDCSDCQAGYLVKSKGADGNWAISLEKPEKGK